MKTTVSAPPSGAAYPSTTRVTVADMRLRWGKFNDAELALIKHRTQLVQQIQDRYGRTRERADRDVEAWANGRVF
jgi:uncharacterized protein YjbJ (UPF0337 family)